ncbi:MAG: hypothetical protein ACSHXD_02485 [Marinosulfonomonas sp.]
MANEVIFSKQVFISIHMGYSKIRESGATDAKDFALQRLTKGGAPRDA